VHESKLLKVMGWSFEIPLPFTYVEKVLRKYFREDKEKNKQLYHLARIIILDSYRTHACLIYKSSVVAISGLILACTILGFEFPPRQPGEINVKSEETPENENILFEKWVDEIEPGTKLSDIQECIELFNELLENTQNNSTS